MPCVNRQVRLPVVVVQWRRATDSGRKNWALQKSRYPLRFRSAKQGRRRREYCVGGSARNPLGSGKPFGVRQTTAPPATRDLPTTLRTKSRFTGSPTSGSSVHFTSKSSRRPPVSTTKSTSRVRSRQKKRLPVRPSRRSQCRSWAKTNVSQTAPTAGDCRRASSDRRFNRAQSRPVSLT